MAKICLTRGEHAALLLFLGGWTVPEDEKIAFVNAKRKITISYQKSYRQYLKNIELTNQYEG